jgi:hypothetical protein
LGDTGTGLILPHKSVLIPQHPCLAGPARACYATSSASGHIGRGCKLSLGDIFQLASIVLLTFSAALAMVSIKKYRNSRGIDFVIQAESGIDPLYYGLVGADPDLIRNAYQSFGIEGLSDEDCRLFPFMHGVYSQISRMYFLLSAKRLDYGLDRELRKEMIQAWVRELGQFKGHPAMRAMHRHAIRTCNFNTAFLRLAEEVFGDGDDDGQDISQCDKRATPRLSPPPPPHA